jgi:hypothetical protein
VNHQYGCFNPLRDIVVPGNLLMAGQLANMAFHSNESSPYHNVSLINTTLFFAGKPSASASVQAGR